jgi:hypothetical protein
LAATRNVARSSSRRHAVAPRHELAQQRQLPPRQVARALDPQVRLVGAVAVPLHALEPLELLLGPRHPAEPREALAEAVAQLEQPDGVLRRVVEHVRGERAHRPVGALVALVELHAELLVEQRGEPERALAQQLRGDARVEQAAHLPAVILAQEPQVVVGVVEHRLDRRVLDHPAERRQRADDERVDHRAQLARRGRPGRAVAGHPRRHLQQVHAVGEAVEARGLGVEREVARRAHPAEERLGGRGALEELVGAGVAGGGGSGSGHGSRCGGGEVLREPVTSWSRRPPPVYHATGDAGRTGSSRTRRGAPPGRRHLACALAAHDLPRPPTRRRPPGAAPPTCPPRAPPRCAPSPARRWACASAATATSAGAPATSRAPP